LAAIAEKFGAAKNPRKKNSASQKSAKIKKFGMSCLELCRQKLSSLTEVRFTQYTGHRDKTTKLHPTTTAVAFSSTIQTCWPFTARPAVI